MFVNLNGLHWRDAPVALSPSKTLYDGWKCWVEAGVYTRMMEGLARMDAEPNTVMIDATDLEAHRMELNLKIKMGLSRRTGRTKAS